VLAELGDLGVVVQQLGVAVTLQPSCQDWSMASTSNATGAPSTATASFSPRPVRNTTSPPTTA